MDKKLIIIVILGAICIFLLGISYNNLKLTGNIINEEIIETPNNSNNEIEKSYELPNIIPEIKNLECVAITKRIGWDRERHSNLSLINYTGIKDLGDINSIAIDGSDYLKSLGEEARYIGIQCVKENGWILTHGEFDKLIIKEETPGRSIFYSESFIEENGYYTRADIIKVICCRIN